MLIQIKDDGDKNWFNDLKEAERRHMEQGVSLDQMKEEAKQGLTNGARDYIQHMDSLRKQGIV